MNITKMTSTVADRVREELKIYLSQFTSTHEIEGIKVELGNCSYDEAMAQYQLKIKVDGVEASLMLFALEELGPHLMCARQKDAKKRLSKRLLKSLDRIQDEMLHG